MKGKFITFEGSEGSGKSTQSKLLARHLRQKGYRVVYLREPGGTGISEKIREILLDGEHKKMCAECETLLYMAARAQVVDEIILPALMRGKIVVCDRFLDSTLAYQGYGLGVDLKRIQEIGAFATAGVKPDLTIFMDLPIRKGLKHRDGAKDRIEKRSLVYHCRVRNGYLAMAGKEPRRIRIVKVQKEKEETQRLIREQADILLSR
jgi:dTMP kinase